MSTKTLSTPKLKLKRLIKAPREQVFAAWTNPREIVKWYGCDTNRVQTAKVDLSIGGRYHFRFSGRESGALELHGVYLEVKRPSKLVYTWNWKGSPEMEFAETLVTTEFIDVEGFTEVRITHEGLPNKKQRDSHNYGWNGCLDNLEKVMASEAGADAQDCCPTGVFNWNELLTDNVAGATAFYSKLLGWKTEKSPVPNVDYTIFKKDGRMVGGCMKLPMENVPSHWLSYVSVEDVDATAKKAVKLGGKVCAEPFNVPTVGRLAVLQDPQGAAFALFKPLKK
jgi:predicted enzyme related to lactoylglutathione lyase/uncharacterized protein YndB with AHSA1/START domain